VSRIDYLDDYLDDPQAPPATSMVPAVNVVATNDQGGILMIRRTDNGNWALPGGAIDLGESASQAAVRETREETGVDVEVTGLVGIYTNPRHVIEYTSNGEVRQEFAIVLRARPIDGVPTPTSEASEVTWVDPSDLSGLRIHPSTRRRLRHHLEHRDAPHID
jgi:8-oxo-dGTP pyrophosphatase MutT (NUDIX family)